jgi:hypothetical protein
MKISKKQLDANRLNAKKGGVKSSAGKDISKLNSTRHGILSREILLENEDASELLSFSDALRQELAPATELELLLVDRIVANTWRLKRTLQIEKKTMSWLYKAEKNGLVVYREGWEEDTENDEIAARQMLDNDAIEKIMRYETSLERGIYRALHELQRIQDGNAQPPVAVDILKDE